MTAPAPPTAPRGLRATRAERIIAAVVAALCLGLLLVAAGLTPSAAGHGTHTQLGLPQCGWAVRFNKPCLTCGMTTAFSHAVRGELRSAFVAQPFGAILAVGVAAGFWGGVYQAGSGSRLGWVCARLWRPRIIWLLVGLAVGAWVYRFATWPG